MLSHVLVQLFSLLKGTLEQEICETVGLEKVSLDACMICVPLEVANIYIRVCCSVLELLDEPSLACFEHQSKQSRVLTNLGIEPPHTISCFESPETTCNYPRRTTYKLMCNRRSLAKGCGNFNRCHMSASESFQDIDSSTLGYTELRVRKQAAFSRDEHQVRRRDEMGRQRPFFRDLVGDLDAASLCNVLPAFRRCGDHFD